MRLRGAVGLVFAAVLCVAAWNYVGAHRPVAMQLAKDARNEKLSLWAYYRYGLQAGTLLVDLRSLEEEAAALDAMRALLQSAYAHQDARYDKVVLAHRGTAKFLLEGEYFQMLGREYEGQNPADTLRTFAQNVFKLDGTAAYGTWTGGLLGVLTRQLEDLNQFSKDWYLEDEAKVHAARRR
jgi:hypothetical protein